MRVWDVPPKDLCRAHLLGEHRELHGLWNILTHNKAGYSKHPETLRWVGKEQALYNRHEQLVSEMKQRGYNHATPLDKQLATGQSVQDVFVNTLEEQREILRQKPCGCYLTAPV
ncbi:MAG: hypothetical protein JWP13_937 [Candidatus Saccharibacteria bacterium]|nr:hypothetical protein [Candidatus Saccharibacteria bacterium]